MLSDKAKDMFKKLNLSIPAIAIKYLPVKPEGIEHCEKKMALCQYIKEAQETGKTFYITKENDTCYGKLSLGMEPKPPVTASGQAGLDFGVYKSLAGCRKLYQELPVIVPGSINYVVYSPVADCQFDPDLIIAFAELPQADIIMRATSYISGDFWESKSTPVISCSWMYAYPVISGKVNHITTGFYHGLKRRNVFESGLRMISIPFNKIDEVATALDEMDWTTIAFRDDQESKSELKRRVDHWQEMAIEMGCSCDLH
ncbi:DUF169 domain-containing protein [Vibrio mangrovi]|uniref:DUF169 domain-containing protein n=1 Tax=Vibrio mangrovi TaxID=474394 RepID=A0A1Y6IV45_9VIBR|nr:DUF169 domain-containing protein [Vibrio mangrovi]MDW6003298.1 DUF169 domain-containing protein [Vibrio mangrovi]SMR99913.1 hypothetical protein VIM7927_01151 [Vibrio mangrovi]